MVKSLKNETKLILRISFQDESNNELPKFICKECNTTLIQLCSFKEKCIKTENKFKEIIKEKSEHHNKPEHEIFFGDEYVIQGLSEGDKEITNLEAHKVPLPEIPKLIQCFRCSTKFNSLHESLMHAKGKCRELYHCKQCPKIFPSKVSLERHISSAHIEKQVNCNLCEKVFKTNVILKKHLKQIHYGERKYVCDICGKGLIDLTTMRLHAESHKPKGEARTFTRATNPTRRVNKTHFCETCGVTCSSYSTYYMHCKKKHNEQFKSRGMTITLFKCTECKHTCKTKAELTAHTRVHTGERPFKCNQCPSSFKLSNHLNEHKSAVHLGVKKYQCTICGKKLNDKGNFDVHVRRHTGEKPFTCDICSSTFYGNREMKKHKARHHPEAIEKD